MEHATKPIAHKKHPRDFEETLRGRIETFRETNLWKSKCLADDVDTLLGEIEVLAKKEAKCKDEQIINLKEIIESEKKTMDERIVDLKEDCKSENEALKRRINELQDKIKELEPIKDRENTIVALLDRILMEAPDATLRTRLERFIDALNMNTTCNEFDLYLRSTLP